MASKPPSSDDRDPAAAGDPELEKKLASGADPAVAGGKAAASPAPDGDDDDEHDELELDDDDDDEDLVVFTAKEAAGALATTYAFVKPFLINYKKLLAFVGFGSVSMVTASISYSKRSKNLLC